MPQVKMVHVAVAAGVVVVLLLASCAKKAERSQPAPASALKVGLVFDVGGRGDKSFNDAAYAGLERAKRELGIDLATLETGEGTDREAALRQLAAIWIAAVNRAEVTRAQHRMS